uniref:Thioredoxin n=1 Tax=Gracilaria ferox TaxID=1184158 RepID=A0A345U753_9FLOR|nr:thioredoxin [Gracilaria ferox]YP_010196540.1 thioredoxin [Gracilaria cervicornis]AXI96289.1 thioredoxin [Gracilaria ferox]UAD83937.1 thioredoxin [Gracilaria cervicornis]UAD85773.1 thioredoxin [Gracilaria ferox]
MSVPQVIDASFNEEVIKSSCPVLVDFWAPWCGPCRMVAPVIDQIANEYQDKLKVVTLNTDENPSTTTEYGIRSIPTLMIFVEGQRVDTVIGAVPKSTLATALNKYIKKNNNNN